MIPLWKDVETGVRVVGVSEMEEIEALVSLFEEVAQQEGWQPEGALRVGVQRSAYFALEAEGRFVGGLQMVLPDASGTLPCHSVWPEVSIGPSGKCAHVAILALDRAVRGQKLLFWRLAVETWRYCVGAGISTLFLEVTPRVLPIYQRLGWPLKIVGERRRHWGEDCALCSLDIADVAEALLRRAAHSPLYQLIIVQAFRMTVTSGEGMGRVPAEQTLQAVA